MRLACSTLAALAALSLAGAASGTPSEPRLRVAVELPLAIGGTSFHGRELVRVTAQGMFGERVRTIRASSTGRFVVRFAGLNGDPCQLRTVRAKGAKGSRALLRLPRAACPALETPPPG